MTEPVPEGPISVAPIIPVDVDPTYEIMYATLQSVEQQGNEALLNLKGATDTAEQALAQMKVRVELGQMGAESIAALETAIAEAKQVQTEMETQVAEVQTQQAQIVEAAQTAATTQEQPNGTSTN